MFKHSYMIPEKCHKWFYVKIFLLISVKKSLYIFCDLSYIKVLPLFLCFILHILPFVQNIVTDKPSGCEISEYQTGFYHI